MNMKGLAITMGVGAAMGAVAIMMMPKQSPARRLAKQAADKVEDAAWQIGDKLQKEMDWM